MPDDVTLRSPEPDELKDWIEPLLVAFGEEANDAEFEAERPLLEPERLINAFDGDRRIGTGGAFSLRLTVPGGEVGASGITAIGVLPDQRRRGVLRQMMDWLFADAQARDEPVAILWASEAAIYQRFGFGNGTLSSSFEVERGGVAFRSPIPPRDGVRLRMVDAEEGARLGAPVYDALRPRIPGSLARREVLWRNMIMADAEWMRRGNGPKYRAVLEVDGEPRGFVTYRIKGDWDPRGPRNQLTVLELWGLDPEAEQRLWQWIFSMDLVGPVQAWRMPMPHPLQQWLIEPRRLGLRVGDGLWLRMLDLPAAMEARSYVGEGTLVLEVEDLMIDSNAGRWQLSASGDGRATLSRTTAEPDLVLDIAALACVYLGALRFVDLAQVGRVRVSDPAALQTADALFTPPRAPYCNTMF